MRIDIFVTSAAFISLKSTVHVSYQYKKTCVSSYTGPVRIGNLTHFKQPTYLTTESGGQRT